MRPWMQTFLGNKFTFDFPRAQDIEIEDIAHSLPRTYSADAELADG